MLAYFPRLSTARNKAAVTHQQSGAAQPFLDGFASKFVSGGRKIKYQELAIIVSNLIVIRDSIFPPGFHHARGAAFHRQQGQLQPRGSQPSRHLQASSLVCLGPNIDAPDDDHRSWIDK